MTVRGPGRPSNLLDLLVVATTSAFAVLAFAPLASALSAAPAGTKIAVFSAMQLASAGAVPAILVALRRESLASYGLSRKRVGRSIGIGVALAAVYLAALSFASGSAVLVPFGRHGVLRLALAQPAAAGVLSSLLVLAVWGVAEGLYGVWFSAKASAVAQGFEVRGAPFVGPLVFGAFNGFLHVAVGQGWGGFWTSALSGSLVGLARAFSGNAWGGVLVQLLTNAAGPVRGG